MNEAPIASTAFTTLLGSLAEAVGLGPAAMAEMAEGLEFEVAPHGCRVLPHPSLPERLVVEVMVRHLGPQAEELNREAALLLHRLNAQARLEHSWVATVDESDHLVLWQTLEIAQTRALDLQACLVEAIERAQALNALWPVGRGPDSATARPDLAEALHARFGSLRG